MTDEARHDRNRARLQELHPVMRSRLARVLARLQAAGYRPRIQDAWRSPADQLIAFRLGHSHLRFGFHNATGPDGTPEALAADVLDDDAPLEPRRTFVLALAREARAEGLATGIAWGLPPAIRGALNMALSRGDPWEGKCGWDPTHCEWDGLTVRDVKAGVRPQTDERLA